MASTIAFSNLFNGQEIELPYEVNGQITVAPAGATVVSAARQIDDNPLVDIGSSLTPGGAGDQSFAAELTATDCPLADTYYMLSIYVWDDNSDAVSLGSVTFKTSAISGAVAPPPPPGPPG